MFGLFKKLDRIIFLLEQQCYTAKAIASGEIKTPIKKRKKFIRKKHLQKLDTKAPSELSIRLNNS